MKQEISFEDITIALTTQGRYVGPLLEVHARSLLIHFSGRVIRARVIHQAYPKKGSLLLADYVEIFFETSSA